MSREVHTRDLGARTILTPWKISMGYAWVGGFFALLLFVFPQWRWLPLPNGASFPTPALVLVLPLIALVWGVLGIARRKRERGLLWCLISIGIATMSMAYIGRAFWTDKYRELYLQETFPELMGIEPEDRQLGQ